jgi:hypothetical protein
VWCPRRVRKSPCKPLGVVASAILGQEEAADQGGYPIGVLIHTMIYPTGGPLGIESPCRLLEM